MPRPAPPVLVAALAAVCALLLVAGVVGVVVHDDDSAPAPAAPAPPSPGPPEASGIAAVLPELRAFVEKERGLRFLRDVDVELLADGPFEERATETDDEARQEIEETEAVLQAMGLLDDDVDLVHAVEEFAGQAILGFYDAETKELVVRGATATPFVRTTLVHELVHALEDQHFDLYRPDLGDEASIGFSSLAEGSAVRVEERYLASLPRRERLSVARAEEAQGGQIADGLPEVVEAAFGFPYAFGPGLVEAIEQARGRAGLDAAFARPPASAEQVLQPERFLAGDQPRVVPVPRADRPAFDDGEVGELFLVLMLQAELGERVAREAAQGWGGDRYVAWEDGARTCARMDFVMDTPADTRQLEQALDSWAAARPATAAASGTSLRTCG